MFSVSCPARLFDSLEALWLEAFTFGAARCPHSDSETALEHARAVGPDTGDPPDSAALSCQCFVWSFITVVVSMHNSYFYLTIIKSYFLICLIQYDYKGYVGIDGVCWD